MVNLINIYSEKLKRDIWLRPDTEDVVVLWDTFKSTYHVPPIDFEPKNVLDLGSNIGLTIAHYEFMWPRTVIYGVEMDRDNVSLAYKNTSDTVILHAAISSVDGYRTYTTIGEDSSSYYLSNIADKIVYSVTLDKLIYDIGWGDNIDFCKMDIEGAELEVVSSGSLWYKSIKRLLVEVHPSDEEKETEDIPENRTNLYFVTKELESKGYTVERHLSHWSSLWATKSA